MSIDIQCEKVLSLREVREILPRKRGKPLHLSSVYRWTSEGLRGVRLETAQLGGQCCTSMEALQRFFDALTTMKEKARGTVRPSLARRGSAGKRGKRRRPRGASNAK